MADEWFVDIEGGGDASQASAAIAGVLGLRTPRFTGDRYELAFANGDLAYVEDDDPAEYDGYPVSVAVYGSGSDSTEVNARSLYDALVTKTAWRLRLADDGGRDVAERPAVSRAS